MCPSLSTAYKVTSWEIVNILPPISELVIKSSLYFWMEKHNHRPSFYFLNAFFSRTST